MRVRDSHSLLRRTWLCIYNILHEIWFWLSVKCPHGIPFGIKVEIEYWFYFEPCWHHHPDYHPSWGKYRKRTGMSREEMGE
jgi:hypothetical protein